MLTASFMTSFFGCHGQSKIPSEVEGLDCPRGGLETAS
jgi:hypothetical protein